MADKNNRRRPNDTEQTAAPEQTAPADTFGLWEERTGIAPDEPQQPAAAPGDTGIPPMASEPVQSGAGEAISGFEVAKAINVEAIHKARQTFQKYRQGKARLDKRIVENEEWYKKRHWQQMRDRPNQVHPTSAWLFNCIISKHADAMDSYPMPAILPREENDREEAKKLSEIVPVVMEMNDFEQVYNDVNNYKLWAGTGVYGVFWDKTKLNGLGDISIQKVDVLNLFWEPGVTDIQRSRNVFHVELCDNEVLEEAYPQLKDKLGSRTVDVERYLYDDTIDTSEKSMVVDWYYKRNRNGKTVLHYCKFVNDEILFATENDPAYAESGWYEHGEYPFVMDPLFPTEGTPTGYSYIDIGKDTQEYIDRLNRVILQNSLVNARPRYFVRKDGSVNEAEFADATNDFIHVDGNLGDDSIRPVDTHTLPEIYLAVLNSKIDELKETTGNRDVNNGGTSAGVTAASGIAAMQEASGKLSRDTGKAAYRAYRRIVLQVIELIRQFYDIPRQFRITGENGDYSFTQYSNEGLVPQPQGDMFGVDYGLRKPLFDVEVSAQKANPYSRLSQNELALQFYQLGFFAPDNADQTLACLEMMDFDRKNFIEQRVSQNGTMLEMIQQLQQQMFALGQMVDEAHGTNEVTQSLMQQFGMQMGEIGGAPQGNGTASAEGQMALGGAETKESWVTKRARQAAAEKVQPG